VHHAGKELNMANVEFCEHDWPGSGCKECRAQREAAKMTCEPVGADADVTAIVQEAPEQAV
jgi:hypothetical protein